jgi:hypothetical protein
MSNAIVPFEEKRSLAKALVSSGLFGLKDEAQALSLMALAESEGMHPAKAVQEYHIIQGKPARKADAVLARFQSAGGSVKWGVYTDTEVAGVFAHPQGGSVEVRWTIADAKRIGLAGKDNWKNYPRAMLRARCISEGVRTVFPGVTVGTYTVEELQDMTPAQARDMGAVEVITPPDPWTDATREAAATAAGAGMTAYTQWWKDQPQSFREAAVGTGTHADMKAKASEATKAQEAAHVDD